MQPDNGPNALQEIWQILKIVTGAVATVAAALWAFFGYQNKRLSIENKDTLSRIETYLKENVKELRTQLQENTKKDIQLRELIIEELASIKEFRNHQEEKWKKQDDLNKEIFEKLSKLNKQN